MANQCRLTEADNWDDYEMLDGAGATSMYYSSSTSSSFSEAKERKVPSTKNTPTGPPYGDPSTDKALHPVAMANQSRQTEVDNWDDYEMLDGAGVLSLNYLSSTSSSFAKTKERKAPSTKNTSTGPPYGDPSMDKEFYRSSLRTANKCRLTQVDNWDDYEMLDGAGVPSMNYPSSASSSFSKTKERKAPSTKNPPTGPPYRDPSTDKESYRSSLRTTFFSTTDPKKKEKKGAQGKGGQDGGKGKQEASHKPPSSSRRSSCSSDSSLEDVKLDSIADVFSAALSFGKACDRRAAAKSTINTHPLAAAYNQRATWGDALFGVRGQSRRRRSARGWVYSTSDDEDARPTSSPTTSSRGFVSSTSVFGFSSLLGTLFGRRHPEN